ncbi:hypothetical protein GGP89_003111 [Salinibacter ruber]|uniref:Uncharacterized protein n=1 Tax=Salinibacter ruber TaxID=146919 RepID=A0A9X2Z1C0_9BACT|nr:hypothetical protein [Salinibacter ruber]MCS3859705.1 hypothetical protein [Salinibacter ruber]MCS3866574.1 hypothetical protein [Salinibacter ruber]
MDESEIVERVIHAYRLKQYGKQISESADKVSAAAAQIPLDGGPLDGDGKDTAHLPDTAHLSDELTSLAQEPHDTLIGAEEDLSELWRATDEKRQAVRSSLGAVTDQEMRHAINHWMERTTGGDDAPPDELEAVRAELDRLQGSPEA